MNETIQIYPNGVGMFTTYNNDCFNVFPNIEPKSVDMVLVDLPYGQTACEWDKKLDLVEMWRHLQNICKDTCNYIFFTTTKYGVELINSNPKWFRYDIVFEKNNAVGFLSANKMPLRAHEMIYIFGNPKGRHKIYNPQKTPGKPYTRRHENIIMKAGVYGMLEKMDFENSSGDRHPRSVIKLNCDKGKLHSTQKPTEICEWLIKTYTNEGETVLDFCMGSGSTLIACINTNRICIGIEKDETIFRIAEERIRTTHVAELATESRSP